MNIKIKNAILQYPNLYEARSYQEGKPNFSTKIILHKKDHKEAIDQIKTELKKICEENKITFKPDSFKCFKDGEMTGEERFSEYFVLTAKANVDKAPKVVNYDLTPYSEPVFSGDVVNVAIDFWHYTYGGMKGISCNLKAVQVLHKSVEKFKYKGDFNIEEVFENEAQSKDSLDDEIPF